jgi:hypothetical protein
MKKLTRRDFLRLSGAAAAAGLLAGCNPGEQPTSTPASTSAPEATTSPTSIPDAGEPSVSEEPTSASTLTPRPTTEKPRRSEIIQFYPEAPSKVVHTYHAGAWDGEDLVPDVLRKMLNASITELTGIKEPHDAWAVLFSSDERIAIKVNSIRRGATHPELVIALTDCLQDAGIPAEQLFIFDRNTTELAHEGYPVNVDGPGVRCYGSGETWGDPGNYTSGWTLLDKGIKLSDILLSCDALINVPILKRGGPGISFAMKNHYGTFDIPAIFHGEKFERALPELSALPPIKDRTRLIIGDVLTNNPYHGSLDGYEVMAIGNTLLMSFDPVAFDTVGVQMVVDKLIADDRETIVRMTSMEAEPWLTVGAEMGLGTNDPANIDLVEVNLA